ncbi:MAG: type III pantothenate kinase [Chloroflexota bacterium]
MLLAINVNNTNTTLGLWDGRQWARNWRIRSVRDKTADEYGIYLRVLLREAGLTEAINGVVMGSVVPVLTGAFVAMSERYLGQTPFQVRADTAANVRILTDNPAEVGADRIANAAGAYEWYRGPSIVIDMGTATTFDVVAADGALLGVAIAPGIQIAADALAGRAAQLSQVALQAPAKAIGRNTIQAMQSGIVFGYAGLVEGLVGRLKRELQELKEMEGNEKPVRIIGTGGLISLITPHTAVIDHVDPWLTLSGLRVIYDQVAK